MQDTALLLRTDRLRAGYHRRGADDRVVLDDVDLTLRGGEMVGLLGPNGSGKSTLLRTVSGVQPPLDGRVYIGEKDVHRLSPGELARRMSLVLTERVAVGSLRAVDLVAMGRYPYTDWMGRLGADDDRRVREALHRTGTEALADRRVDTLSDGERQKVLIARALAQDPQVMILDEPTAHLDLPNRLDVMRVLRDLAHERGCAVLLSTHELDLALQTTDRIALILPGGVLRTGLPEAMVLDGAIEEAFGMQRGAFDPATGAFRIRRPHGARIGLSCTDEALRLWTRRALERTGWTVELDVVDAALQITAERTKDGVHWRLHRDGEEQVFVRLEPLLQELQKGA